MNSNQIRGPHIGVGGLYGGFAPPRRLVKRNIVKPNKSIETVRADPSVKDSGMKTVNRKRKIQTKSSKVKRSKIQPGNKKKGVTKQVRKTKNIKKVQKKRPIVKRAKDRF